MADPRLASHQHFDVIRCKLCDNIYNDPRLLTCLHSFCKNCLENYVKENVHQGSDAIACPLCEEITSLKSDDSVDELLENLLLQRLITQAQREQTKVVAEQEVLKIQAEALTEEELESENVQKTILHIANTAGQVIAHKTEDQSRVHDFETIKHRQELQKKIMNLQEKALDIVYAIDEVNQEMQKRETEKDHLKDAIKQRSQELQNIIHGNERKLLARLEDRNTESEMKDLGYEVKTKLHKTLKGTLNAVDFLKLLVEYGDKANIESFQELADERIRTFMKENVEMKHTDLVFESPKVDLSEAIELMFGSLTETTEMKTVWNPLESKRTQDQNLATADSSPNSDIESHIGVGHPDGIRHEPYLTPRYAEINESNDDPENDSGVVSTSALKHRRRPLKSMSFDETTSGFLYKPNVPTSHSHFINRQTEMDIQNENDQSISETHLDECNTSADQSTLSHADETGRGSQSFTSYPVQYSGRRRASAPPSMIIDALAKRRLNALSILERSNISTKGLGLPTDAEMGLNQARLEWMRENLKRKNEGLRRSSIQEDV